MIQLTYLREKYATVAKDWKEALDKAIAYVEPLIASNDESFIEDYDDLKFIGRLMIEAGYKFENIVFNTVRLDDIDGELYSKEYDGSLMETYREK